MKKIQQLIQFVYTSQHPWCAVRILTHSILLLPALVFHELMHITLMGLGIIVDGVSNVTILERQFFHVQTLDDGTKQLRTSLSINYSSRGFFWGKAVTLAPLYGYVMLVLYSLIIFHPLVLCYCVFAFPVFFLSDMDIKALEDLSYDPKKTILLKKIKTFLNQ